MSCHDETATIVNGRWICQCPGDDCDKEYQKSIGAEVRREKDNAIARQMRASFHRDRSGD